MSEVGISVITEAELRFGVARRPGSHSLKRVVEEFLLRVESLAWNSAAAGKYARIRASLEKDDSPMGNLDLMIVAQAVAAEVVLVTRDHVFRRVTALRLDEDSLHLLYFQAIETIAEVRLFVYRRMMVQPLSSLIIGPLWHD